jgi:hypothetical protein
MELLVLGLLATVGIASYALWSRARTGELQAPPQRAPALPPADRTPATLQIGDVVQHLGTDYVVEGVLMLSEEARGVRMCKLTDGTSTRFICAAPPEPEPALLELSSEPVDGAPESLVHQGHTYQIKVRAAGTAIIQGSGFDKRGGQRLSLALYSAGAQRLAVLTWPDATQAFSGERLPLHLIEILPGK